MATVHVNLTPELERLVREKVEAGLYDDASDVVREALRLLLERDQVRNARLEELRTRIRLGVAQARRGELVEGEDVFARLEAELDEAERTQRFSSARRGAPSSRARRTRR